MTTLKSLVFGSFVAIAVLAASVSPAEAQYPPAYAPPPGYYPPPPPPPPRGVYRTGLVIGGALGFGGISAVDCGDVCGGVFSLEGHIGGMMNPRLAVMADLWANLRNSRSLDATVFSGIYTGALQYWVTDQVWLKGGIGVGHMQLTTNADTVVFGDEWGFAAMGAAGIELVQSSTFALDLHGRFGHAFYSQGGDVNNFTVNIGLTWF